VSDADTAIEVGFEEFFVAVEPRLRAALSAEYGPDLGREATAEALAWAFEHWSKVRSMRHPVGYLFRVGQSRTRRARRRSVGVVAESSSAMPEVEPALVAALVALPERQRVTVVLVHGYGWTHVEVAEVLGIRPSSVATHVQRAIASLRTALKVGVDE